MVKDIPSWLKKVLKTEDIAVIEQSIGQAELKTSGEIIPMIVKGSSTVGHVPVLVFCLLFIGFLSSGLAEIQGHLLPSQSPLWWLLDAVLFSLISVFSARWPFMQRQLTSDDDLERQVNQRAELEFYEASLHNTTGGTGVLIFLSLMERKVVVLADKTISSQLDPKTWAAVVDIILAGIAEKNLAAGLAKAIETCGDLLAPCFPVAADDVNEVKDSLIIKD